MRTPYKAKGPLREEMLETSKTRTWFLDFVESNSENGAELITKLQRDYGLEWWMHAKMQMVGLSLPDMLKKLKAFETIAVGAPVNPQSIRLKPVEAVDLYAYYNNYITGSKPPHAKAQPWVQAYRAKMWAVSDGSSSRLPQGFPFTKTFRYGNRQVTFLAKAQSTIDLITTNQYS